MVEFYGDQDDPFLPVSALLGTYRLLGVEKGSLPLAVAEKVLTRLHTESVSSSTTLADVTGIISDIRLIKDDSELQYLRMAAHFSDQILSEIRAKIHIGSTEKAIAMEIMGVMAAQPKVLIDDFAIQVLAGTGSADPHGYSGDRILKEGDPVSIDFGVCYQHYWSDCTRTFFVGPPKNPLEADMVL